MMWSARAHKRKHTGSERYTDRNLHAEKHTSTHVDVVKKAHTLAQTNQ